MPGETDIMSNEKVARLKTVGCFCLHMGEVCMCDTTKI